MDINLNDTYFNDSSLRRQSVQIYDEKRGSVLVDGLVQAFLLGFIFGQVIKYWSDYRDDPWRKQLFVGTVIVLSVLQTVIEEFKLWRVAIDFQPWAQSAFAWTDILINGFISWMCEAFFIRRCWKITNRNPWALYGLGILSGSILLANTYLTINLALIMARFNPETEVVEGARFLVLSMRFAFTYWIFASLALDLIVAVILIFNLWRSKTGQKNSDQVVNSVIWITCISSAMPCITMVCAVSLYHSERGSNLVLLFVLLTSKFYTFGLLRSLNARRNLRLRMKSHGLGRVSLSTWRWDQMQTQATTIVPETPDPTSQTTTDKAHPFRVSFGSIPPRPSTRATATSSILTSSRLEEEIAPHQTSVMASGVSPMSPEITFSSPRLDSLERGYTMHRLSSITTNRCAH
ncbi:hypothetical protein K435DRAFT_6309 [Dendrothele bispora CBS 962.96]|uniref:DUF6534 domain-containing protein n=1 Tax=Dendrothele bispora (strain CBS 962.96) TaxID=1314807 RepID=A0A4S8MY23_DENBC|nr:hypothetical protein K435DRAFT_6309 [Dendrothele bispora CBS 962.96]